MTEPKDPKPKTLQSVTPARVRTSSAENHSEVWHFTKTKKFSQIKSFVFRAMFLAIKLFLKN